MDYAELLCLTNFSFQLGASHPRELVERAKELGYAALAIADECSLAGIVRAHEAAETAGLPLIIGSQFRFEEGDRVALLAPTAGCVFAVLRAHHPGTARVLPKGTYSIEPHGLRSGAISETIALWVPGPTDRSRHRRMVRRPAGGQQRYLAHAHHLAQDSARRLDTLLALRPAVCTAGHRRRRCALSRSRPAPAARCHDGDPPQDDRR